LSRPREHPTAEPPIDADSRMRNTASRRADKARI
jgi:hypothetical protein